MIMDDTRDRDEYLGHFLNLLKDIEKSAFEVSERVSWAERLAEFLKEAPKEYQKFVPLSDLTKFVFDIERQNDENLTFEVFKLCRESLEAQERISLDDDLTKVENALILLSKIKNHYETAFNQKIMMDQTAQKYVKEVFTPLAQGSRALYKKQTDLEGTLQKFDDRQKEIDEKQNKIDEHQKNNQRDFVAVLGMFTTIIFAAFGGLQLLAEVFKGLDKTPLDVVLIHGSFVFISLIIIISLLLSGVSRMSNLPIRSCHCNTKKIHCYCSFAEKHPTIFFSVLLVSVITSFALMDKYFMFSKLLVNAITLENGIQISRVWILLKVSLICLIPAIVLTLLNYTHQLFRWLFKRGWNNRSIVSGNQSITKKLNT